MPAPVPDLELFLGLLSLFPGVQKPSAEELKQAIYDGEPPSVSKNVDVSAEPRGFLAMGPCSRSDVTSFPSDGSKGKTIFQMR